MIDPNNYILRPLDQVQSEFEKLGFQVKIKNNNFGVIGDKKLVTNVVISSNVARIYYGDFIFDLEGKNED